MSRSDGRSLLVGAGAWVGAGVAAGVGWGPLTLLDVVVLLACAVVLPLALGASWAWVGVSVATAVALSLPTGVVAAAFVAPWLVVVARQVVGRRTVARDGWYGAAHLLAAVYAGVAGVALASSRFGAELFGIGEPIVQLTAVHYAYAGTAALVLAGRAHAARPGRSGRAAVLLTGVAPPIVAVGFVTGAPGPQVGGAALMTLGVWCTAALQLDEVRRHATATWPRLLLAVSGLAVWVPMVLATAWAAAQHWSVPAMSVADMARTHGVANAFGFALCGLLARRLGERTPAVAHRPIALVESW